MLFGASRRLRQLEEDLETLKRTVANRDLDWDDMRARCKRLLDRAEKAASRATSAEEVETDVSKPTLPTNATTISTSPERLAKIQQQLRDRGRKVM